MKITMLACGTRGDVQPFVMLGERLRARGHQVRVGTTEFYKDMVDGAQLEFRPVSPLPGVDNDIYQNPKIRKALSKGPSTLRYISAIPTPTDAQVVEHLASMESAVADTELLITETNTHAAGLLGKVPNWYMYASSPMTPTREFPACIGPQWQLGPVWNRLTHKVVTGLGLQIWTRLANQYLSAQSGRRVRDTSRHRERVKTVPYLYGFSAAVVPKPADWPSRCHITGFWVDSRPSATPDRELEDFVSAERPPVVLTLGSHWPVFPQHRTIDAMIAGARRVGRPLVIVGGPEREYPADVVRRTEVNYGWLFPRAAAVVHAASLGTTAYSVRSGVPQVTLPVAFDQPAWAHRMFSLGLGTRPILKRNVSAEALIQAVERAVVDRRLKERASEVADRMRDEDGLTAACDVLENA